MFVSVRDPQSNPSHGMVWKFAYKIRRLDTRAPRDRISEIVYISAGFTLLGS